MGWRIYGYEGDFISSTVMAVKITMRIYIVMPDSLFVDVVLQSTECTVCKPAERSTINLGVVALYVDE